MNRKVFCVFLFLVLLFPLLGVAEEAAKAEPSDTAGESQLQREFREALNGDGNTAQCRLPGLESGNPKLDFNIPTIERSRTRSVA